MTDIKKAVDNFLKPHAKQIQLNDLFRLIQEAKFFNEDKPLTEEGDTNVDPGEEKTFDITFPKIRITEDFGKIGTEDREIVEKFTRNIVGSTLEEKIATLNSVLTERKEGATIGDILSTMVVCEILSAIITNFTESAGGFIFEGFLAGLFGGESMQITSPEDIPGMEATGKPITDVMLGKRHYSLKLLGQTTGVKGSFRNMVDHFKSVDHVVYLDARRVDKDQGLEFGEFTITLENFLEVFVDPFQVLATNTQTVEDGGEFKELLNALTSGEEAIKGIQFGIPLPGQKWQAIKFSPDSPREVQLDEAVGLNEENFNKVLRYVFSLPYEQLQKHAPFTVKYAASKFEGTKAEKLFGSYAVVEQLKNAIDKNDREEVLKSLRMTPGYENSQQFEFTRKQAEDIANFRVIGTLMIGEKYMKETYALYADLLMRTISPIYEQLQLFTNNINDYFLGVSDELADQDRKQYAMNAIDNAGELAVATNAAVEEIEN